MEGSTKWTVYFYRPGEDKPYISCFVWSKTAGEAEEWALGYFRPVEGTGIKATTSEE